jgi:tetratricopeptide (TPR) repeat protein
MANALEEALLQAAAADRAGRLQDAARIYNDVLKRVPDLPATWFNLGRVYRRLRLYDAALATYQEALNRGLTRPEEAHLNRAVIYADDLHRPEAAEAELHTAVRLNGAYVPALLNLANLHEDRGERDAALALYERILAVQPGHPEALARLANASVIEDAAHPVIERLEQTLATPGIGAADRASLGFALGRALDRAAAYGGAFEAYAAANRASRESMGAPHQPYDRVRHEALIDELIATFDGRTPQAPAVDAEVRPIFICGMFRSGSTLAEQALAAHSQVRSGGELDFIPTLARTSLSPFPRAVPIATPERLGQLARYYDEALARLFPGPERVTDKRPDNFLYLGLIKSLFPRARIVHTTRDPLDNCLSIWFLHLDHSMSHALDLLDIGHYYRQYRRLMAHWQSLYGEDVLDFGYEAFVREPRPALQRLLAHCGLPWEDACLAEMHRPRGAVKTASVWQVRQPLYTHSIGRWRHYAQQLEPLRQYLADLPVA